MRIGSLYTVGMQLHKSKCQQCGKRFEHGPEYRYKVSERYYCSYKCMRTAEAEKASGYSQAASKRYLSQEEKDEIIRLYDEGFSLRQIQKMTGRSNTSVADAVYSRRDGIIPVRTRKRS